MLTTDCWMALKLMKDQLHTEEETMSHSS
jgi:hypothetical protein